MKAIQRATEMLDAGATARSRSVARKSVTLVRSSIKPYFVAMTMAPDGNLERADTAARDGSGLAQELDA